MTDLLTRPDIDTDAPPTPQHGKGDVAHIVAEPVDDDGNPTETVAAWVTRARFEGFAVTALCGYTWIPHKDPKPLPVCAECKDIYEHGETRDPSDPESRKNLPDHA